MKLWQTQSAEKMKHFIGQKIQSLNIEYTGSMLDPKTLDIYSDVDMDIHLANNDALNIDDFVNSLNEKYGIVFGYETHYDSNSDILRICFANGHRYDFSFRYPHPKIFKPAIDSFAAKINRIINQFWYIASLVLIKLGRSDYLTAAHLALELCQLIIVIQMLERDNEKNTNIHRRGDKEDIPIIHSLYRLKRPEGQTHVNNEDEITGILFEAAEQMDKTAAALNPAYIRRTAALGALRSGFGLSAHGKL